MRMLKILIPLLFGVLSLGVSATPASAQTCPAPAFYYGWVPTAAQWNQQFYCKQAALGYTPVNRAGDTMQGKLNLLPSNTLNAGLNLGLGFAPTAPLNGDAWLTSSGLSFQLNGLTIGPHNTPTYTGATAPSVPTRYSFWNNTSGSTIPYNIYDGAQWVNIGTLNPSTHVWSPSGGIPSGTSGGIPYFSTTTTLSSSALLAANQLVLGGGVGTAPATLGSLGTTTTVLHGNAAGAPTFGSVSLTADVSGLLPGANGGTGVANTGKTITLGASLTTTGAGAPTLAFPSSSFTYTYPSATSTLLATNGSGSALTFGTGSLALAGNLTTTGAGPTTLAFPASTATFTFPSASKTLMASDYSNGTTLTSNALLTGGGAGAAPNAVALTGLVIGNGASAPTAYAGSGACASHNWVTTISATGVTTCTQPAFTDISGSVAASQMPALTGDVTTSAGAVATTIANNAVTNAKAAQMAANTIKGNNTGSTANAADLTAAQVNTMLATAFTASQVNGQAFAISAPPVGLTLTPGAGLLWQATVSFSGLYTNSNGTPLSPAICLALTNSAAVSLGTRTMTWTMPAGGAGWMSWTDVITFSSIGGTGTVQAQATDCEGDGGSHAWQYNLMKFTVQTVR